MSRRRIYLMRHGQVRYFTPRTPMAEPTRVELTELGRAQASAAGAALHEVRFDRVITSGLPRTKETARLMLEANDHRPPPAIEEWPELEEFRVPVLDLLDEDDVADAFLTVFRGTPELSDRYLTGETVGSVLDRVNPELDRLMEQDGWETVLMVLHGGVNRAIISRAITGSPAFLGHIEQTPGCINILDHGPDWLVRSVNVAPIDLAHSGDRATSIEEVVADYREYRGFHHRPFH